MKPSVKRRSLNRRQVRRTSPALINGDIKAQATICLRNKMSSDPVWELDDLIQEGWIIAQAAVKGYKTGGNASFRTYLTRALMNRYDTIAKRSWKRREALGVVLDINADAVDARCPSTLPFSVEMFCHWGLSDTAAMFMEAVFNPPADLIRYAAKRKAMAWGHIVAKWMKLSKTERHELELELAENAIC